MCTKFCFLCCVSVGGLILLSVGASMLVAGYEIHNNPTFDDLENGTGTFFYISGSVIFAVGIIGAIFSWMLPRKCRCCFLVYAIVALTVGTLLILGSNRFRSFIKEESGNFSNACMEAQMNLNITTTDSSRVNELMSSWTKLKEAYDNCLQVSPTAISLLDCPDSTQDSAGTVWREISHWKLLKFAEDQYTCGGFCREEQSLFGLPEGTVDMSNRSDKRENCMSPLIYDITKKGEALAKGLWIMGLLAALSAIPAFCLFARIKPSQYEGYDDLGDDESLVSSDDEAE